MGRGRKGGCTKGLAGPWARNGGPPAARPAVPNPAYHPFISTAADSVLSGVFSQPRAFPPSSCP